MPDLPPETLLAQCTHIPQRKIRINSDIIQSKEDWQLSYENCAKLHEKLVLWIKSDIKK